jgi:phage tail-like protein
MTSVDETRSRPPLTTSRRKFSTSRLRLRTSDDATPAVASARGYLRRELPTVYLDGDGDVGLRFLGGLETLLDPILATLDALPSYFDPDLAPRDVLDLLASWLGLTVDESWSDDRCREAVRLAAELGRRRGTRRGLELGLRIAFPDLPLRVEDGGKVTYATDPDAEAEEAAAAFVVYCDKSIGETEQAAIARVIERAKPIHVSYRLRVKAPRKQPNGDST